MDVICPCGESFRAKTSRAKYCSARCRKRAQRTIKKPRVSAPVVSEQPAPAPVVSVPAPVAVRPARPITEVTCPCGETFRAKSSRAKYCSDRCRKRMQRAGRAVQPPTVAKQDPAQDVDDDGPGPVLAATIADLEQAGRLDTTLGQVCLALAARVDRPGMDTGSSFTAVVKTLKETLRDATRGTGQATAPQQLADELAARREKHGA